MIIGESSGGEGLSIADCRLAYGDRSIDNLKLAIGNRKAHPLLRGGTDLMGQFAAPEAKYSAWPARVIESSAA